MKSRWITKASTAVVAGLCVTLLSGCGSLNDLNPIESDKKACDQLSTLITNLGQPNALDGEAALQFAQGLESNVRPNATTDFAKDVDGLINALKSTSEDSIFAQAGGALDMLNYSTAVASHCVDVSSGS